MGIGLGVVSEGLRYLGEGGRGKGKGGEGDASDGGGMMAFMEILEKWRDDIIDVWVRLVAKLLSVTGSVFCS